MKNREFLLALVFIAIGFIYRMIPNHPHNFTPVAAMALVGGLYIHRKALAFLVPIAALFMADIILNNTINRAFFAEQEGLIVWADYMLYTYSAILLTVIIGMWIAKKSVGTKILGGALFASVLFFVVTNFGSWLSLPMYPKSPAGLLMSYEAGIPFFQNTLISNLVFVTIFVGSIEWLKQAKASPIKGTSLN